LRACSASGWVVLPAASAAAAENECIAKKPNAASYTWNFQNEANNIFADMQSDAAQVQDHAAQLQSFALSPEMSWQSHADQLNQLRREINDLGERLCRLETIRRVVAPWQQRTIDRVATTVRLMADNAEDAISVINRNHQFLWSPTYEEYANNLYSEAKSLDHSMGRAVEYAKVRTQFRDLRNAVGTKASS
jgi:hypothetical protein